MSFGTMERLLPITRSLGGHEFKSWKQHLCLTPLGGSLMHWVALYNSMKNILFTEFWFCNCLTGLLLYCQVWIWVQALRNILMELWFDFDPVISVSWSVAFDFLSPRSCWLILVHDGISFAVEAFEIFINNKEYKNVRNLLLFLTHLDFCTWAVICHPDIGLK